jgi:hypothetical protein
MLNTGRYVLLSVLMILAAVSAHLLKNFDFPIRGLFLRRPRLMVCQSCAAWVHSGLCPTEHIVPLICDIAPKDEDTNRHKYAENLQHIPHA